MAVSRIPAFLNATTFVFAQSVTISSGRITGKDLGDVQEWLGIPYAAPPTGDLRWKAPQPPASWEATAATLGSAK